MRTEPPETARVLDPGLGAAPVVALTALACLVGIGISVLSVPYDPLYARISLLVALACIPFGIAVAKAALGSRMDASGVWKAHWYGWRFYSADGIESVEWCVYEGEGGPASRVLLRLHGRWSTVQVSTVFASNRAEAMANATEVGDLLGKPVRRASSDQSERFRDWPTRRPKRTRRKVGGDTTTPD
jgi:hypothetical protein